MFNPKNIDKAHSEAQSFCNKQNQNVPEWINFNACGNNKDKVTSAFQCITASATPVPTKYNTQEGRNCYQIGNRQVFGAQNKGPQRQRRSDSDMPVEIGSTYARSRRYEGEAVGKSFKW